MASQDRDEDTLPEYLLELRREGAGEDEVSDPAPEGTDAATAAAAPP